MQGFLLVFSVTSEDSLNELFNLNDSIKRVHEGYIPIVIVANKCDLPRTVEADTMCDVARNIGAELVETSARTGAGVNKAFERLVTLMLTNKPGQTPRQARRNWKEKCVIL
eukprot:c4266_g1_i1.p1 GENE.c4266_g1_i1~~c4266_g1_i1.p1  ORF type:complete len:111 (+),score=17.34 c4266_g1_i1:321-653(+)